MAFDRNKAKKALRERMNDSEKLGDKEAGFVSYFNVPEGVDQWQPQVTEKGNDHMFDIVPFEVGSNYPTYPKLSKPGVKLSTLKEGDPAYCLSIFVHNRVGPQNLRIVCPNENYGLPCPICEERDEQLNQTKIKEERREIYKKYGTGHRILYNVIVRDGGELQEKGVQVFEWPYNWTEKEFQARKINKKTGEEKMYASPDDDGFTISFNVIKDGDNWTVSAYELYQREPGDIITDEEIESATTLDEIIDVYSYEDIKKLISVGSSSSSDEEAEEEVDEEVEEKKPSQRKRLSKKEEPEPEPEEAEEESDMGDDVAIHECPFGAVFGTDFDEYDQCDTCKIKSDCQLAKEKASKPKLKKKLSKKK